MQARETRAAIYAIEKNGDYTDLLRATANQVSAFSKAPNGGLYCSTSNLGKIFLMSNGTEPEGTFESDVKDAQIFSRWGRAEVRGRGNFDLFARSGNVDNPDRNWSPWARIDLAKDARTDVPAARFIQWRAVLKPANPPTQIDEVAINYLSKNVAPIIDDVVVQVGARFQPQAKMTGPETIAVNLGPPPQQFGNSHMENPPTANKDRGSIAVRWAAHDENDDNLVYSVYYRGDNEREWKLLKSDLTDKFYSFESGLLPDGGYTVKVVASDAPSHSPEDALSDEKESQRFEVDNTAPRLEIWLPAWKARICISLSMPPMMGLRSSGLNTPLTQATGNMWNQWARCQTQRVRTTISPWCSATLLLRRKNL